MTIRHLTCTSCGAVNEVTENNTIDRLTMVCSSCGATTLIEESDEVIKERIRANATREFLDQRQQMINDRREFIEKKSGSIGKIVLLVGLLMFFFFIAIVIIQVIAFGSFANAMGGLFN